MSAPRTHPAGELLQGARATWGTALLVAPGPVLRLVGEAEPDPRSRAVVRVLGARHLAQAAFSGRAPGRATLADGAWVDVVHAVTSLALAAGDRPRARLALLDALVALTWGTATARAARRVPLVSGEPASRRERLARAVHPLLPGAPAL
ncbi:hypothetical protein FHN55_11250 [Streptomyces sp. NP160]|uniref:hypothetical protein n=1 Tax=Streptomyces sp. NP160 TaxID=2586637 RepID=UPI001118946C|nr:hypothetical protein [Streptomyces sp. NP160]TNM67098.1 hypothetical protein FHN55_11250 [Streptomyces sp. NP160]